MVICANESNACNDMSDSTRKCALCCSVLQGVAGCCSLLQCVTVCCSVLQRVVLCCSMFQCVAACCSVLQCVAVCCSVCNDTSDAMECQSPWHFIIRPCQVSLHPNISDIHNIYTRI